MRRTFGGFTANGSLTTTDVLPHLALGRDRWLAFFVLQLHFEQRLELLALDYT